MVNSSLVQGILADNTKLGVMLGTVKKISVKDRSWLWPQDITVQVLEDGILVHCNHAGAEAEVMTRSSLVYDPFTGELEEREWPVTGIGCDKCPAWKDREERRGWYE